MPSRTGRQTREGQHRAGCVEQARRAYDRIVRLLAGGRRRELLDLGINDHVTVERRPQDEAGGPVRHDRSQREVELVHLQSVTVLPPFGQRDPVRHHRAVVVPATPFAVLVAPVAGRLVVPGVVVPGVGIRHVIRHVHPRRG